MVKGYNMEIEYHNSIGKHNGMGYPCQMYIGYSYHNMILRI